MFGGKDGQGQQVTLPDGTNLRRRDRLSIALLNQFSAEYRARFLEDKLLVNIGVRVPYFTRDLNNFCFQQSTFNAYCTTQVGIPVPGTNDGTGRPLVTFPAATLNSSATLRYGQPRAFTRKYDDVLPNVGVSYDVTEALSVYGSYAETISVPRTDDLYDQVLVDPGPETSKTFDLGVRYQSGGFLAAASIYKTNFNNRIERVLDEPSGIAFSQNVGDVENQGFDAQIGFKPMDTLSIYASYSYIDTEIQQDIKNAVAGILPTLFDGRTTHARAVLADLPARYGVPVLPPISRSIRFAEAPATGRSILATARSSRGAQDYRDLAESLDQSVSAD